jgi:hypothetical protein
VPFPGRLRHQKFFQENFWKKKIGLLEVQEIFFFQKVDFWSFFSLLLLCLIVPSQTCLGSGQTCHMTKFIFQKKNPFNWDN